MEFLRPGQEQRDRDRGLHVGPGVGVAHHHVGGHRVAEHREAAVAAVQAHRVAAHRVQGGQEVALHRAEVGQASAQRLRIAAVAGKIEGDGDVAVARQGGGEGLHQLLRAGEAVRHHHHRRRVGTRLAEHGQRDVAEPRLCHREPGVHAIDPPQAQGNREAGDHGDEPSRQRRAGPRGDRARRFTGP